ncbi:MAG: serine/threonine protein phosphatase [Puniceicoccales bacterium]
MHGDKDTKQAKVRIGYDGRVHKTFVGPMAKERFENELRVLTYLEEKGCDFVPRMIENDPAKLYMVTTNCGKVVEKISDQKLEQIFSELETYGVRHEDRFARNVTYSAQLGRFCLIDFEFATILETGEGLTVEEVTEFRLKQQRAQAD